MAVSNYRYKIETRMDNGQWEIIAPWCKEYIGTYGITWGRLNGTWRIRFKRHAVLFALRWS
jgi:hypothetical protein